MLDSRDKRFGVSYQSEKKSRSDILMPKPVAGANYWQSGKTMQLKLEEVQMKNLRT
jgi:hypothetical protein